MISFDFTVKDRDGIHARPAGAIIKAVSAFKSDVIIDFKGRSVSLKGGIFALLGLGIRCGDTFKISVKGEDEMEAAGVISKTFDEFL